MGENPKIRFVENGLMDIFLFFLGEGQPVKKIITILFFEKLFLCFANKIIM